MKIQLGNFKERIRISRKIKSKDAAGSPTETELLVLRCWSQRIEVGGEEDVEGKVRVLFDVAFIIKYDARFTNGKGALMIVKDDPGIIYHIDSVVEVAFRKYLRINCVKDA